MQSKINWKQGDYIKLGKAVKNFNNKIKRLQAEENKLYLPEEIDYQEAKQNITTRKELNRIINSLKRFQDQNAEDLYITEAGEQMTKWERKELGIQSRIAQIRLQTELKALNNPLDTGYSRVQMGSQRARAIESTLQDLKQIEKKSGYDFKRLKSRILSQGSSDYIMKKSIIYRENYMNELKKYAHLDNYNILISKLNQITNPVAFFEFMSANELTQDLTYQSDEYMTQQAFNSFIEQLGIEIENDSIS